MTESKVFMAGESETMNKANMMARNSFNYFWREMYWERRRIVPAVDIGMVKAGFQEGEVVEHMWVNELNFDGYVISGFLVNQPHELTNIKQGDAVEIDIDQTPIDWLLFSCGIVYGGFSIHDMRLQMTDDERQDHDDAWGLPFGDPTKPALPEDAGADHPMAEGMVEKMLTFLNDKPEELCLTDEKGYTLLHYEAVAGNAPIIEALLSLGVDTEAKTLRGDTAMDLAKKLRWDRVVKLL